MKRIITLVTILLAFTMFAFAQENVHHKHIKVPAVVKTALYHKYRDARRVTWEKENGNYEANWGGKSGEDNSVQFTPSGEFIEIVRAIRRNQLPEKIIVYVNKHYKGVKITEAGKVTNAVGKISYEIELNDKDVIFDEQGNFIKSEK